MINCKYIAPKEETMSIASKLKEYLEKEKISYSQKSHAKTFSAAKTAGEEHIPGKQYIKSILVKVDGKFMLCVLPAIHLLDLDKLKKALKAKNVEIVEEEEMDQLFPEYESGAIPPFGHLKKMPVICDKIIEEDEEIAFCGGTHTDTIHMKYRDFKRLEKPQIADIGHHI